jgi:hypothetical protein
VSTIDVPSVSLLLSYVSGGLGIGLVPALALAEAPTDRSSARRPGCRRCRSRWSGAPAARRHPRWAADRAPRRRRRARRARLRRGRRAAALRLSCGSGKRPAAVSVGATPVRGREVKAAIAIISIT